MIEREGPTVAFLGIGSNLGDRRTNLRRAVDALREHPCIDVDLNTGVACLYETQPMGVTDEQPDFLNSALRIATTLSPDALLAAAFAIETAIGRVRRKPWAARTIDIDLLLYGDLVMSRPDLTVPHRLLAYRRFVLEPLADIAADVMHPLCKTSIARLAERCRTSEQGGSLRRIAATDWALPVGSPIGACVPSHLDSLIARRDPQRGSAAPTIGRENSE